MVIENKNKNENTNQNGNKGEKENEMDKETREEVTLPNSVKFINLLFPYLIFMEKLSHIPTLNRFDPTCSIYILSQLAQKRLEGRHYFKPRYQSSRSKLTLLFEPRLVSFERACGRTNSSSDFHLFIPRSPLYVSYFSN